MKKFKTSEDLDQVTISLPLNVARTLLTMCSGIAEKASIALQRIDGHLVPAGKVQRRAIALYLACHDKLHEIINVAIVDNVSVEDQQTIKEHEIVRIQALEDEIVELFKAYPEQQFNIGPDSEVKQEFDVSDLPEGTVLSPGSDEEN